MHEDRDTDPAVGTIEQHDLSAGTLESGAGGPLAAAAPLASWPTWIKGSSGRLVAVSSVPERFRSTSDPRISAAPPLVNR